MRKGKDKKIRFKKEEKDARGGRVVAGGSPARSVAAGVRLSALLFGLGGFAAAGVAQESVPLRGPVAAPEAISDNSFFVEEAYNQEPGVVQHIFTHFAADDGPEWIATFTQEWPAPGQRHQLSYTLAGLRAGDDGWGDLALHYRWQGRGIGDDPVAVAPRLSLLLPTGDARRELGFGAPGLQVNLPVSAALAERWVSHSNVGGTWVPDAEASDGAQADASTVTLAQSVVWLARPKLNLMLEATWTSERLPLPGRGTEREETFLVSPGVRFALDFASGLQVVPGLAVPIGVGPSDGELGFFVYLSLEHPF